VAEKNRQGHKGVSMVMLDEMGPKRNILERRAEDFEIIRENALEKKIDRRL
jgi:hypothetical protein